MVTRKRSKTDELARTGHDDRHDEDASKRRREGRTKGTGSGQFTAKRTFAFLLIATLASLMGYQAYSQYMRARVNLPFDPKNPLRLEYSPRKWGSLRSGAYFGLKTMSPESLVTGLMWFKNKIEHQSVPIRHWCNQNDRLASYSWSRHDFDNFGVQEILDGDLNVTTKFIVNQSDNSWMARVLVESRKGHLYIGEPLSVVYYVATESKFDKLSLPDQKERVDEKDENFYVKGSTAFYNDFFVTMSVDASYAKNVLFRGHLSARSEPPLVNLKETFLKNLYAMNHGRRQLFVVREQAESDGNLNADDKPNFIAHQITFMPPFAMNIHFSPRQLQLVEPEVKISTELFERRVQDKVIEYDRAFESLFHLKAKGYSDDEVDTARRILSNMVGSIGYFFGNARVQSVWTPQPVSYGPLQLLTSVPSRSFFPRGFLWDEGFHNLLLSRYRPDLSVQIIRSWFNLMNVEGWIPREVILGGEAEARVPAEFMVQKNVNANPPTLFLTLESLLERGDLSADQLRQLYPRLETWYQWFNTSQNGHVPGSYRWRGRDPNAKRELNPKTLTSGLDDYPRATHPTDQEIHVDLRTWMTLASRVMAKVSKLIDHPSAIRYQETAAFLADNEALDQVHWSSELGAYCDHGLHSTNVKLVRPPPPVGSHVQLPKERKVITEPEYRCVQEFGYIALFPFLLQVVEPSNTNLDIILTNLRNSSLLWTNYGLRSLSRSSSYYAAYNTEHDPPYWRGAIWLNINYLALKALRHYSTVAGPSKGKANSLYNELRQNVVGNVLKNYQSSGYIWEQYDDKTGQGKGSHPFTGWSALVVLIMAEEY